MHPVLGGLAPPEPSGTNGGALHPGRRWTLLSDSSNPDSLTYQGQAPRSASASGCRCRPNLRSSDAESPRAPPSRSWLTTRAQRPGTGDDHEHRFVAGHGASPCCTGPAMESGLHPRRVSPSQELDHLAAGALGDSGRGAPTYSPGTTPTRSTNRGQACSRPGRACQPGARYNDANEDQLEAATAYRPPAKRAHRGKRDHGRDRGRPPSGGPRFARPRPAGDGVGGRGVRQNRMLEAMNSVACSGALVSRPSRPVGSKLTPVGCQFAVPGIQASNGPHRRRIGAGVRQ